MWKLRCIYPTPCKIKDQICSMITMRPTCCYLQLDLIWKSKRPFWIWSRISNFNVSWSNIRLAVILSADRSDPRSQAWTWQYFVITLPSPAVIRSAGVSVSVSVQFQSHLQSQFQFQFQFQVQSQLQFSFNLNSSLGFCFSFNIFWPVHQASNNPIYG